MEMLLTVEQILKYVDSFSKRSCLTEAEDILSSNLLMCGLESKKDDRVHIEAICLPSDSVKKHSYVVNCSLFKNEDEWTIQSVHCTCNSKSCKHCIAVLLYCNRNDISDSWDEIMRSTDSKYTEFISKMPVVPISEFCCVKPVPEHHFSESKKKKFREDIVKLFPDSAYAKDKARYKRWKENVKTCGSGNTSMTDESKSTETINTDKTLSMLLAACPNSILAQSLKPKKKEIADQPHQAGLKPKKKEIAEQPHQAGSSKRLTRYAARTTRKNIGS